jgi:superfamily II DNA helicase RecQ
MRDSQVEELEKLFICQDVFVIQPTGKRKSPIYQSAPVAFEIVRLVSKGKLISLVMSPLPSLMQDQVLYLKSAAQTSEDVG